MILIADSGSSKTDWILLEGSTLLQTLSCIGLNPNFSDDSSISNEISNTFQSLNFNKKIDELYFYGSGCGNETNQKRVKKVLLNIFPNLHKLEVLSDILGAARGICNKNESIACILGTGSNSCLFDGEKILFQNPSYGYIFGDEGSGADIGKRTLQYFFEKKLSNEIMEALNAWLNLTHSQLIEQIYLKPKPNRFLASISKFHSENISNEELHSIRKIAFTSFFANQISRIPDAKNYLLNFSGSIAYHFAEEIKTSANEFHFQVGEIYASPIKGLATYHSS
jgi:N-acetylglucosamine kinase-like BadF-type ATPase